MTYKIVISTKRFLRKPKIETFIGAWKSEEEVKRVLAKCCPKAELLSIEEVAEK